MNMQDYRHAADRVQIADHCKEEVLGMNETRTARKPAIRIVTGITAAAACLGITGAFGYSLMHMKQQGAELSAATQLESQIESQIAEEQPESEAEPVAVAADDREFPMIDRMTDEMRTRTFDWGTIRLDCISDTTNADGRFPVMVFIVKLNDDIDIAETDVLSMSCKGSMYDYQMLHKVSTADGTVQVMEKIPGEAHDRLMMVLYPMPEEGGKAICLTRGDDGTYAEQPGDDFLYKEPMPEYLLYELTVDRIAILDENGNEKRVLLDAPDTPLFKARKLDLEAEIAAQEAEEEPVEDLGGEAETIVEEALAEDEDAPWTENLLLDEPVEYEYDFGKVTVEDVAFCNQDLAMIYSFAPSDALKEKCTESSMLTVSMDAAFYDAEGKQIAFTQGATFSASGADNGTWNYQCTDAVYDFASDVHRHISVPAGSTMKLYVSSVKLKNTDGEGNGDIPFRFYENLNGDGETTYAPIAEVVLPYDAP